jgi:hypothetical protein
MSTATRITGRGWAYIGTALGGAVSVAANVAHSYVPPANLPESIDPAAWTPEPGAVLSAVIWPVFLFVAIEILARYSWPAGRRWLVLRFGGLLPVALVAAVVSYRHLSGLLEHYGEDALTVAIGPLAVDGLMIMAAGALIATARRATVPAADDASTAGEPARRRETSRPARGASVTAPGDASGLVGSVTAADATPPRGSVTTTDATPPASSTAGDATPSTNTTGTDVDDLLLVGRAVATELEHAGTALTRAALIDGVRARGRRISTTRASELLRQLKTAA